MRMWDMCDGSSIFGGPKDCPICLGILKSHVEAISATICLSYDLAFRRALLLRHYGPT